MSVSPNMRNPRVVDVRSEPRPLRRKELLEKQRSQIKKSRNHSESRQECEPLLKNSDMRIPSIIITQAEFRVESPKKLLERMERSSSTSKISPKKKWLRPENRERTWERPTTPSASPPNLGLPLRKKELLERQRSKQWDALAAKAAYYQILSSPVRSQVQLKTPDKRLPPVTLLSAARLEGSKALPKGLESSAWRSASASKIPTSSEFLTPEDRRGPSEDPKTPEMNSPCCYEPGWEARPLRTKELLERQRQASATSRSASASKIEPKRTKAAVPAASFTTSRQLVPSIGFSYPKAPQVYISSTAGKKPPSKLTNTKRNLFHQKEALQQKLERITEEWLRIPEPQLRQQIVDFVNSCLPSAGAKCSHLSRDSYVNQLMEALQQLQYPREVHKTWLRMPKSHKAISHVLEILRFLMDFANDEEKESLCVFPIFPDGKQIFEEAARAFRSGEELTEPKLEESCTSSEITSLQEELENLKLQPQDPDLCTELHSLQQEKQHLQEELANCQMEIKLSTSDSANKLKVLGNFYMKKLAHAQLLKKLKERVRNQSCSIQDYVKMLNQREELSEELRRLRLRFPQFAELLRISELKLKSCRKEQKESIEAFNVRIRDYEFSLASESSYPTSLQLSSNATIVEVEDVLERLKERRVLPNSSPVKHISSTCRLPLGENNHTPH